MLFEKHIDEVRKNVKLESEKEQRAIIKTKEKELKQSKSEIDSLKKKLSDSKQSQ